MANIEEKIENLIKDNILKLGYELYDVEYVKEGKDYFLRIYIDKHTGIDLEDCEKVSNNITGILDEYDYIKEQYFLEVSSPGVERVLRKEKHLNDNIGKIVNVKLFKPLEKQKQYIGILLEFNDNVLTLEIEGIKTEIERKNIAQIRKTYNWE